MAELALGQGWQRVNGITLLAQAQGLPVLTAPTLQQDLGLSQLEKLWRMPPWFPWSFVGWQHDPLAWDLLPGCSTWCWDRLTWVWSLLVLGTAVECARQWGWTGAPKDPSAGTFSS